MAYAQLTTIGGGDTADQLANQLFDLATKAQVYVHSEGGDGGDATMLAALKAAITEYTNGTF